MCLQVNFLRECLTLPTPSFLSLPHTCTYTHTTHTGKHDWATLRNNVQDYIKSLNFSYRVQLREAGVTYLNKLGTFLGPNTMELVDNKGEHPCV